MSINNRRLTVRVHGSIANLGPGFDVFALALSHPSDVLAVETTRERGVRLKVKELHSGFIPRLVQLGFCPDVWAQLGVSFSSESGVKGSILQGGTAIPEGVGDREEAERLYERLVRPRSRRMTSLHRPK